VVGLVGATTEMLRSISNVPDHVGVASSLEELRAVVQAEVNNLEREGVDVIVLLSHLQDARKELQLIDEGLVGVDIVVAGGGDNRLANKDHRLLPDNDPDPMCGGREESCYPIVAEAGDGRPVLLVATDGQFKYLGRLSVGFDAEGVLTGFDEDSRPWPVDEASLVEVRAEPARDVLAFAQNVREQLAPLSVPFGETDVFLEGRRHAVRNRQTNLGDLSADALLSAARRHGPKGGAASFAMRNGGGIRSPIGTIHRTTFERQGGPLRPIDVKSAFRFNGEVVVVDTTHQVLRDTLESALRGAGTARGRFPQVSEGVYLEYTKAAAEQSHRSSGGHILGIDCPGQRIRTLRYEGPKGTVTVVEEGVLRAPKKRVRFATIAFLAGGGDGWFPAAEDTLKVLPVKDGDTAVTEQTAFVALVEELSKADRWKGGAGYPDPQPGQAHTFTRVREVFDEVAPAGACVSD
jgi:2',3'-cyclic-nucleotide 2'-phosphodiesterase (5'-nucleotidase family)